ncbi:MAG: CBASS cGAMP-activated phospholipase [Gammaproteobacteria bacterium]|nr:CBASS cGAMP-activated phospholipase [Gammaproteobacteria bacterium]
MSGLPQRFNILALSGGGFRGLFTATVLTRLEEQIGRPVARCFNLICGSSVGGIIGMALALEIPADEIRRLFESNGNHLFQGRGWIPQLRDRLGLPDRRAKYSNAKLKELVCELFGKKTLEDSMRRLLITSVNFSTGRPQFFKTPHHPELRVDAKLLMSEVAMATSAAPVFFPAYQMEGSGSAYVDGGLAGNAPGLFGVHEAKHFLGQSDKDIQLLSIGTAGGLCCLDARNSLDMGAMRWREHVVLLTLSAQESVADSMLCHELGDRYLKIDVAPNPEQKINIDFDATDAAAIQTLKSLGDDAARHFLGKPKADAFLTHEALPFNFHPRETEDLTHE